MIYIAFLLYSFQELCTLNIVFINKTPNQFIIKITVEYDLNVCQNFWYDKHITLVLVSTPYFILSYE